MEQHEGDAGDAGERRQRSRSSKFSEGRLKLSTSCTECHRRKQKCNQQQPCQHCSRRYPPPPCIYRSARDSSALRTPSIASTERSRSRSRVNENPKHNLNSRHDSSAGVIESSSSTALSVSPSSSIALFKENEPQGTTVLSVETLDVFNTADEYQRLVDSMVSHLPLDAETLNDENEDVIESRTELQTLEANSMHSNLIPVITRFGTSSVDPLHFLGITPTIQSAELLQGFIKIITKYVFSIDGNPSPNYYNDVWIPWSIKSPLLAYLGIFTSACYQAEAQRDSLEKAAIVLRYKLKAINILNEMLSDPQGAVCDEAVAGVIFLTVNEWYWSNRETVQAHMKGLKEMIRLRGGLNELGMNDFIRRMILSTDYYLAASYNWDPLFDHFVGNPASHLPEVSSPLIYSVMSFRNVAGELQVSKEAAIIFDDMRFLLTAIVSQTNQNLSDQEMGKLLSTSVWIHNRILAMPEEANNPSPLPKDFVYKSARLAALIYCKAIVSQIPLSKACTILDLNQLWASMWQVKLSRWKQIPGIFLFIILAAIPAAQNTPHGRFLKSMLKGTCSYMSLENWEVVDATLNNYVRMQRWLRNESPESSLALSNQMPLEFMHIYRGEEG